MREFTLKEKLVGLQSAQLVQPPAIFEQYLEQGAFAISDSERVLTLRRHRVERLGNLPRPFVVDAFERIKKCLAGPNTRVRFTSGTLSHIKNSRPSAAPHSLKSST